MSTNIPRPDPLAALDEEIRYQRDRFDVFASSARADGLSRDERDMYHCDASRALEAVNALERVREFLTGTEDAHHA